jgi:hypothetical protein
MFYPDVGPDELTIQKPVNELRQSVVWNINPLNAKLNPICYLPALLGAHHFLHVSRIRVNAAWIGSCRRFRTTYRRKY